MFPFMRVTVTVTICCIALMIGSNLSGFFKSYKDDPAWVEPASAKQVGDGAAGGDAAASSPGAKVFSARCATCHQGNGKGLPGIYPPLAGSQWVQDDHGRLVRIVLNGFQGKIQRGGKEYNGVMTPWKDVLSDEEIADVLTYIRSSWGNNAAAVDAATVKDIRAKTVGKSGAYIEAELQNPL